MSQSVQLHPRRTLTAAQKLIWTSQRLHPDVPLANMANLSRFTGDIDPERFVAAVEAVVVSSDALRMRIREVDGVPHPSVAATPTSTTEVLDLDVDETEAWVRDRIATPLDPAESVYDSVLLQHGSGRWSWWFNVHHIATDAASSALIFQSVAAAYAGQYEPGMSFEELTAELDATRETKRWQKAAAHWADQTDALELTGFYQPEAEATTRADRINVPLHGHRQSRFDALLADRFRLLSEDLSQSVALATVIACYLHRLNGSDRITIGMPIHHRTSRRSKTAIGPLVELFPVTIEIERDDTFASLQERTSAAVFEMLRHAQPGTSPRQNFDVVLNNVAATFGSFGDMPTTTTWIHPGHIDSHHRLRVQALDYDGSGELQLGLDLNHAIAGPVHRDRAGEHFGAVLDAMLDNPDARLDGFGLATDHDLADVASFTHPTSGRPLPVMAPDLVAEFLAVAGDRIVLTERGVETSGAELDGRVEAVADRLRSAGIGPGDRVAIEIPISTDAVTAIHGVLRAGAAFVPIDPTYPEVRRDHIREDSRAAITLTSLADLETLDTVDGVDLRPIDPDDLAYVIYTSGSTGLPKGVPITHAGLCEYLGFALASYVGDTAPTMPLYTSLSFDLTITTLFLPFISGGAMTVHPDGGLPALREIVEDNVVTLMKATPSHLELLVRMIEPSHPLTGLIVGGEAFMTELADRILLSCGSDTAIWNEYGPTEAVVGCMLHRYSPERDAGPEVPIGHNAPGVALHILDSAGYPVPLGAEGELYISRPGMTTGYLGRDDLNAEKFGSRPATGSHDVVYRTGDRVRMLDSERMVYLGRVDHQIKVRGVRLEPGEIESAARSIDGIDAAVAGLWVPDRNQRVDHCVRCGLGSDVPGIVVDADGVCTSCHEYDVVAPQAAAWFRTEDDLHRELRAANARSTGDYDVLHLLSGGKDSTYALYRLVEMGARVLALTLDNGFISDGAKDNVRRATAALGVDHEFVTVDAMNEIFRDSLERFSNVCNGCYKAIYTIALERADRLGIPAIVTGLSRGQFFETRLVPGLFETDRFDPNSIDVAVTEARRIYHRTPDAVSENMDVDFLQDGEIFDRVSFIDLYRYIDVELAEMYRVLESSGTWERPEDTGRSTNCLINSAGIYVHKIEQAHHNYALPYSWDVRLGHKTREEAMFELDDPMDEQELASITEMLAEVGYEPKPPEVLTLWITAEEGAAPNVDEVRAELVRLLPAHAHPQAIELIQAVPLTVNGKVDTAALPAPASRRSVSAAASGRLPETTTEQQIASVWAGVLGLGAVSANDDFFALGGTSLHALEMIVRVSQVCGVKVNESLAFTHRTVADLAEAVEALAADPEASPSAALDIPTLNGERPLSPGEASMLYEWRLDPSDLRYNVARLYYLPGGYDRARFDAAVRAVVQHQPTLRTSYGSHRSELPVDVACRIGEASSEHASLRQLADQLNRQQFDLINGPLMTVHHLSSDWEPDRGLGAVLIRAHHIVSDASSLDSLWSQIDIAYQGGQLPHLPVSYAEHGEWMRANRPSPDEMWLQSGDPAPGRVQVLPPGGEPDGFIDAVAPVTADRLRAAADTTTFTTLLTALAAAMAPWHDDPRFEVSIAGSVRDHPSVANLVGYFVNPLPMLVEVDPASSLTALSEQVHGALAMVLERRTVPFADLVAAARDRGVPEPGAGIMLAFEDVTPAELDGEVVHHATLASGASVNDATFFVQIRGQLVELGCEYRGATIGRAAATEMLDAFAAALAATVERPADAVASVAVVEDVPAVELELEPVLVPRLLDAAIEVAADRPAVRCGDRRRTHAEVADAAGALAGRLRAVGVEPGDRVGVVLARSTELVVAIRAIWMLGAAYVPVDVSQPPARVTELMASAEVSAVVTDTAGHEGLHDVVRVDVDAVDPAVLPPARPHAATFDDEAYVIFTSGSTGRPKGVSISHGNLASSLAARRQWYSEDVRSYLLISSAGFDSSVAGIFWTLADGGELVVPTEAEVHDVDALLELIADAEPSHTLCVPSLYGAMLQRHGAALPALETIIVAGEACPPELVRRHHELTSGVTLVNEYGPTEATVWATAHRCDDSPCGTVPIGAPIPGVRVRIEAEDGSRVPAHVPGELVLLGPTVSSGYIGDVESGGFTNLDGEQAYRTGDRVVERANGVLEFLGRIDDQLSVGGVRIEPGEVEHTLLRVPGVAAAAVGRVDGRLRAWVEADDADGEALRRLVAELLPPTHVPSSVSVVERLPRTRNGKVDRSALSALVTPPPIPLGVADIEAEAESQMDVAEPVANTDATLQRVRALWSQSFDGRPVDANDDFFDMGGDSLRAVELVGLLETAFGWRIAIGELIDAPTPAEIADRLRPASGPAAAAETVGESAIDEPVDVVSEIDSIEPVEATEPPAEDEARVVDEADDADETDDADEAPAAGGALSRWTRRRQSGPEETDAGESAAVAEPQPVAEPAVAAESEAAPRENDGLVEWLRSAGDKPPLIMLPPGGGNLLRYAPLVRTLDRSIPVVGIRLPGADARSATVEGIDAQAAIMLEAIDSTMSEGPYRLVGWSTGGLLAWEIARLLQERGDEVELVCLIDTLMAGMSTDETRTPMEKYADLLEEQGVRGVLDEGFGRLRERAEFGLARRRYRTSREKGATPDMADAERHLGPVIRRAAAGYEPRPLDVPILYIAASETGTKLTVEPWTALQEPVAELDVVTIEGSHYQPEETCIVGPHGVDELVAAIMERLTK